VTRPGGPTAETPDELVPDAEAVAEPARIGPPVPWLALAAGCVAVSAALLLVPGLGGAVVGYLLASVVAIGAVGLFRRGDLQRRQLPLYLAQPKWARLAVVVLVAALIVTACHTWAIATELAK
jgi:hypothetical protein